MPLKLLFGKLEFNLDSSRLRIGRAEHLDITIVGDPLVSSQHCVIQHSKLCDQQSTNGTQLNRAKIPHATNIQLKAGDVVTVGETNLYIEEGVAYEENISAVAPQPGGVGKRSKSGRVKGLAANFFENGGAGGGAEGEDGNGKNGTYTYPSFSKAESSELTSAAASSSSSGGSDGDDLSSTIHSTQQWNDALQKSEDDASEEILSDEDDSDSPKTKSASASGNNLAGIDASSSDRSPTASPYSRSTTKFSPSAQSLANAATQVMPPSSPNRSSASVPTTLRPPPAGTPQLTSASPNSNISPSDDPHVAALKAALSRSELKCISLEKKLNIIQKKQGGSLLQTKQKITKFEEQIQDLEYQMFYGDSMKDREVEVLKQSLGANTPLGGSGVGSATNAASGSTPSSSTSTPSSNNTANSTAEVQNLKRDIEVLVTTLKQTSPNISLPALLSKDVLTSPKGRLSTEKTPHMLNSTPSPSSSSSDNNASLPPSSLQTLSALPKQYEQIQTVLDVIRNTVFDVQSSMAKAAETAAAATNASNNKQQPSQPAASPSTLTTESLLPLLQSQHTDSYTKLSSYIKSQLSESSSTQNQALVQQLKSLESVLTKLVGGVESKVEEVEKKVVKETKEAVTAATKSASSSSSSLSTTTPAAAAAPSVDFTALTSSLTSLFSSSHKDSTSQLSTQLKDLQSAILSELKKSGDVAAATQKLKEDIVKDVKASVAAAADQAATQAVAAAAANQAQPTKTVSSSFAASKAAFSTPASPSQSSNNLSSSSTSTTAAESKAVLEERDARIRELEKQLEAERAVTANLAKAAAVNVEAISKKLVEASASSAASPSTSSSTSSTNSSSTAEIKSMSNSLENLQVRVTQLLGIGGACVALVMGMIMFK